MAQVKWPVFRQLKPLSFLSTFLYFGRKLFLKAGTTDLMFQDFATFILTWQTQRSTNFMLKCPYRFWQDGGGSIIIEYPQLTLTIKTNRAEPKTLWIASTRENQVIRYPLPTKPGDKVYPPPMYEGGGDKLPTASRTAVRYTLQCSEGHLGTRTEVGRGLCRFQLPQEVQRGL